MEELDIKGLGEDIFAMLAHVVDKISKEKSYQDRYVGEVMTYDDTGQTEKLQVKIFGLFDEIPTDSLPWAMPSTEGRSGESIVLPEIGSIVSVYFENGDIYRPVWTSKVKTPTLLGETAGDSTRSAFLADDVDYGDIMVLFENAENVLQFNRKDNRLTYKNVNGTIININGDFSSEYDNNSDVDVASSMNISVGGDNDEYSLSIIPGGITISNGSSESVTEIAILDKGINILSEDGGVFVGTKTNATSFDEATTMRSTSPGMAVPDPANMGPYCAIPVCPFSGLPHTGNMMTVTGAPMVPAADTAPMATAVDKTAPTFE
jgi:hypothetical protein